jgi:hypothetical protein
MKTAVTFALLGSAIGATLGSAFIALSASSTPDVSQQARASDESAQGDIASNAAALPSSMTPQAEADSQPGLASQQLAAILLDRISKDQGGVSLVQLNAIAQIVRSAQGREGEFLALAQKASDRQGGISLVQMEALAGVRPTAAIPPVAPGYEQSPVESAQPPVFESQVGSPNRIGVIESDPYYGQSTIGIDDSALPPQNTGAIDPSTGYYYSPSGSGYVSTRDGTYYVPAGPNGVINTRSGQFIPTN